ncbi:MAG: type II toxin-antitoxin system HicA family toxin [Chloroflexi bacterium]|nr:type II toxin-antitoxin system HicA family toxin [Chloroflexota bacterium]
MEFIRRLRRLGFEGPSPGRRHERMNYQGRRMILPSNGEYSLTQLRMLIRQVEERIGREITVEEWNSLN